MEDSTTEEVRPTRAVVTGPASPEPVAISDEAVANSEPFVGRWNRLVSTTNWEKGRIISEWRGALERDGAAVTEYSDEAWAQLVGHVTGQHVGRLRRVHERFAAARDDFDGLYWSHFQAALDWKDAEMWLEGAVRDGWSISKMRAARWEAVGAPDGVKPDEGQVREGEMEPDAYAALRDAAAESDSAPPADRGDAPESDSPAAIAEPDGDAPFDTDDADPDAPEQAAAPRSRPFERIGELPDDVAEAFEQFKLAIVSHRLSGWDAISQEEMVGCLEALRALALAPPSDD